MAVGFSFKVAPGVRIRATRRGMRASVGPRAARVHVGGGYRPTVSTGAGPVTLYSTLGRTPARRQRATARAVPATRAARVPSQGELNRERKVLDAQAANGHVQHLLGLHRGTWEPVRPPVAPPPGPVDEAAVRARHEQEATAGIGRLHRSARREALEAADAAAEQEIGALRAGALAARARAQEELDRHWAALCANDSDVVLATLAEAYDDNEVAAAAVGIDGDHVSVVVLVGGPEVVPDRLPSRTQAGNLSLTAASKATRNGIYTGYVCGHVLAVVRETLAVAPGVAAVRIAAIRARPPDAYGRVGHEVVLAGALARPALAGVAWDSADAATIFGQVATDPVVRFRGQARELVAVDLTGHVDLQAMLGAIDHKGPPS